MSRGSHNHPAAGKAGIARLLAIERYCPGLPGPGRRSPSMKTLAVLVFACLLALTTDASDVQVITVTTTNAAESTVTTTEVFTRAGQTNLVRQTKVGDGGVHIVLQKFYHRGLLVGEFGGAGGSRALATVVSSPYQVSFGFGSSGEIFSAAIAGRDGACVDAFGCTNGMFFPGDVRKVSAYLDAFKTAVVVNFPDNAKPPDRK